MASRPIIAAVNGRLTRQTVVSWPDLLHAWCRQTFPETSQPDVLKKEYFALPLPSFNVFLKNWLLARGLAAEIERLVKLDPEELLPPIHFISHSNGTDIVLKTIKMLAKRGIRTNTTIFIGSVLRADLKRNGVLKLIGEGQLQAAFAYCSKRDGALAVPRLMPWCAYGHLGISGWTYNGEAVDSMRAAHASADIVTRRFDRYGHGTYFDREVIHYTFRRALADMGLLSNAETQRRGGSLQTATRTEGRGDV
jgi:hypothetical protein